MIVEVFVDASAWIAISDVRGKYHQPAVIEFEQLVRDRITLVTTNLVIAESYVMIQKLTGTKKAFIFLDTLRPARLVRKVYSEEFLELQAESILRQYSDQDFSFTDAVSFAIMHQRKIEKAFAFDHHFNTDGFVTVPG